MSLEDDYFTFTWHIKNFSMCPAKHGEFISSPVFKVSFLKESKWTLRLYPKGYSKNEAAAMCYLKCDKFGECSNSFGIKYKLSISEEIGHTKDGKFDSKNPFSEPSLLQLDYILKNRDKCLPNDTMIISCVIRNDNKDLKVFREKENQVNGDHCFIETTVEVLRKSVIWPIRRFQTLQADEKLTFPIISVVEKTPSFIVTFFKNITDSPNISIRMNKDGISDKIFVRCSVSVLDIQKHVMRHVKDEYLFDSDMEWLYPTFVNLSELGEEKYFERTNDTLYICFDIAFSIEGKLHHVEQSYCETYKMPITSSISPAEYKMLSPDSEDPNIVSLRSGDRTYEVHRRILEDKSKVFEAMNEMKEKTTEVVDIPDVDPDTLGRLLWFLYSHGTEDDLSLSDAIKLYRAAHKYQVLSLISHCSLILESSLAVSNVTDVLSLADLHQDNRLLKVTETFIRANSHRVLVSQDWKDLIKTNGTLAANVMLKMLTND